MSYSPPELYWWCLPPLEREALTYCIGQFIGNPLTSPLFLFNEVWEANGGTVDDERYGVFFNEEGLSIAEITSGEDVYKFLIFDAEYYVLLVAFYASHMEPPTPPCYLSRYTVQ